MKKIIILIIISFLLSGCSIYNPYNFIMPDDVEFIQVVESLDTPLKIVQYMIFNFKYEYQAIGVKTPYQLWKIKKGDCNDFSNWVRVLGNYHGYTTYQIRMILKGINHWLGVFDISGELFYTSNQFYCVNPYKSFEDIVKFYCIVHQKELIKYQVYDYDMNIIKEGDLTEKCQL